MFVPRANPKLCSPQQATQLSRAVIPLLQTYTSSTPTSSVVGLRLTAIATSTTTSNPNQHRHFSTTPANRLRDFFPAKETANIRTTPPAWPHHGYTEAEMLAVEPGHREPVTLGDRFAWRLMRICRWGMDLANGLSPEQKTDKMKPTTEVVADKPLTEAQWLIRFIFLESIAGVPGMIAGMLRHLHSIRRLKRDNGWIETLLEESYNERMHLLTFMKMCEPGWLMKFLILGAQGVYFNAMFLSYLISPKICHRFVGYLEEEAVHTYTRCIHELEAGYLPKWTDPKFQVPDIAVSYWKMPEGHRTMKDLILYIRADEASHRGVNHTLGNLNQKEDPNPFVSQYRDGHTLLPMTNPKGWEREEVL
ncbi:Alternative oxidase, mitochondrial [Cytospora mali]|uniref:Alternative oxidase n=1 Tax=Cytospora mali TaxID=578113 RepID=A0A194VYM7_CYTMA|nr:Alternative oxidase, mitochondrial [Valsa mali]